MITLTQRLHERDETIIGLQAELDAQDQRVRELQERFERQALRLAAAEKALQASSKANMANVGSGSWLRREAPDQIGSPEAGELNALPRYLPERSFAGCKLLRLALSSLPAALSDAVLTDWEQKVVSHVEVVAQELSEAAVPKLLAKLDSTSFREYLDQCCPSVSRLSSQELLEQLTRHLEAAEVVSGFPAVIDPAQMYPDSAGMSVDYLNGSFFLNDWQAVPWLLQTGFSLLFCENSDNHKKLV
eukprot:g17474.t1